MIFVEVYLFRPFEVAVLIVNNADIFCVAVVNVVVAVGVKNNHFTKRIRVELIKFGMIY